MAALVHLAGPCSALPQLHLQLARLLYILNAAATAARSFRVQTPCHRTSMQSQHSSQPYMHSLLHNTFSESQFPPCSQLPPFCKYCIVVIAFRSPSSTITTPYEKKPRLLFFDINFFSLHKYLRLAPRCHLAVDSGL